MMDVRLAEPWLICDMGRRRRVLSWAVNRPGFVDSRHVLWRKVDDADLPPGRDVATWLDHQLATIGHRGAPCLMTARRLDAFETASATVEGITARCIATVGLSNAERVGRRQQRHARATAGWGTINVALLVDHPLSDGALLESLSIIAQARTVAVAESRLRLPGGIATGTGTDCIAVAADPHDRGRTGQPRGVGTFAGLHTAIGEAVGAAALAALGRGVARWLADGTTARAHGRDGSPERRAR